MGKSTYPVKSGNHAATLNAERLLEELSRHGDIGKSCRRAGIGRAEVDQLRRADDDFNTKFECALTYAYESLEAEARRRAVEGIRVPVMVAGKPVYADDGKLMQTIKYSDALLIMLIRQKRVPGGADMRIGSARHDAGAGRDESFRQRILDDPEPRLIGLPVS